MENAYKILNTLILIGCLLLTYYLYNIDIYESVKKPFLELSNLGFGYNSFNRSSFNLTDIKFKEYAVTNKCNIVNQHVKEFTVNIDGVVYPKHVPLYFNQSLNFDCMNENKENKLILLWNTWFGDPSYGYGLGKYQPFINNRCPVTNCELTNDRNRLNESDFIIFHMRDSINALPSTRKVNQHWIFLLYESPIHSHDYTAYNGLFNMSSTYKFNSNFTSFYAQISLKWGENKQFNMSKDYQSEKTMFATAVISNCNDHSRRLAYIRELQKHIQVDLYGNCGKGCPNSFDNGTTADCIKVLAFKYKFYLAFENSICDDYITEKFLKLLTFDIIPVVLGGGNYEYFVPKSGYINVFDYKSANELANYLKYLDTNKTAYNSYFQWKKYIYFDNNAPISGHFCEFCIKLNLLKAFGTETSTIKDFSSFWSRKEDCYKKAVSI